MGSDQEPPERAPDALAEAITACRKELRVALAARDHARVSELESVLAHLLRKASRER